MRRVGGRAILGLLACMIFGAGTGHARQSEPRVYEAVVWCDSCGAEVTYKIPARNVTEAEKIPAEGPAAAFVNRHGILDRFGLISPKGKVLLKTKYRGIKVKDGHLAIVIDDEGVLLYDLDKQTFLPQRYYAIRTEDGGQIVNYEVRWTLLKIPSEAEGCPDWEFRSFETLQPMGIIPDACDFEGYDHTLIAISKAPDGKTVSRLYDVAGQPVPVKDERGQELPPLLPEIAWKHPVYGPDADTVMVVGALTNDGLADPRIFRPMNVNGTIFDLPEGVLGLVNLSPYGPNGLEESGSNKFISCGWAIVYPKAGRNEYALGLGSIEEVLGKADSLPRYQTFRQLAFRQEGLTYETRLLAAQRLDGSWEAMKFYDKDRRFGIVPFMPAEEGLPGLGTYPTYEALIAAIPQVDAVRAPILAQRIALAEAKVEAERELAEAQQRAKEEAEHWDALRVAIAEGDRRKAKTHIYALPGSAPWAEYIDAFGPWNREELGIFHRRLEADPHATNKARLIYQEYRDKYDELDAQAAAQAAAQYQEQMDILAQERAKAARAAYATRKRYLFDAEKYGDESSTYDQAMQNLRDTYQQNLQRRNEGGNVWVPDNPDN